MKKTLLSMELPVYKANLHTHTTLSDGKCTPEQIKAMYLAEGYSIVAYTDHDILLDHADLCDERFLALNGYEIEVMESAQAPLRRSSDLPHLPDRQGPEKPCPDRLSQG